MAALDTCRVFHCHHPQPISTTPGEGQPVCFPRLSPPLLWAAWLLEGPLLTPSPIRMSAKAASPAKSPASRPRVKKEVGTSPCQPPPALARGAQQRTTSFVSADAQQHRYRPNIDPPLNARSEMSAAAPSSRPVTATSLSLCAPQRVDVPEALLRRSSRSTAGARLESLPDSWREPGAFGSDDDEVAILAPTPLLSFSAQISVPPLPQVPCVFAR